MNSNSFLTEKNFLPSLDLCERDTLKRCAFLVGPGSLNNQFLNGGFNWMIPNHDTAFR